MRSKKKPWKLGEGQDTFEHSKLTKKGPLFSEKEYECDLSEIPPSHPVDLQHDDEECNNIPEKVVER